SQVFQFDLYSFAILTAASAFTRPKPYQLWNLNPAAFVIQPGSLICPGGSKGCVSGAKSGSTWSAVTGRMCFTSRHVRSGFAFSIKAMITETTGVADEVPLKVDV